MNVSDTLQKLVNLLGHSENDPELQALFIGLGEKFPLKRPKSYDNGGYLLEDNKKKNRGYHLGMKYAEVLPLGQNNDKFNLTLNSFF
jgi:hypothetical protein